MSETEPTTPKEIIELAHLMRGVYSKNGAIDRIESEQQFGFLADESGEARTFRQTAEDGEFHQILEHYRELSS